MRTFYIFRINDEFARLTKECPYNLFKSIEDIYYTPKNNIDTAFNLYEQIVKPFDKNELNDAIYDKCKDSDHYTKFNNTHMINNFYSDEQSKLIVNSTYIILKSSINSPSFFKILECIKDIFICDFDNKDYFWLQSITV